MKAIHVLAVGLALALLVVGWVMAQGALSIPWWVIGGGGGPATGGGDVAMNGTLGQTIIGPASGDSVSLGAGFWYGDAMQTDPWHVTYLPVVLSSS